MMIIAYIIANIIAFFLAATGHDYLSGAVLILVAVLIYYSELKRTGNLINLRGLFALGFVGGEGVSCLKLSYLQTDWELLTWICFFAAFLAFWFAYEAMNRFFRDRYIKPIYEHKIDYHALYISIIVITIVSAAAFSVEAIVLKYIPLFVIGVPHAYSEFHISGVHYFTVASVLVPSFSIVWIFGMKDKLKENRGRFLLIAVLCFVALLIPMLCVSRFHFAAELAMAFLTYIVLQKTIPWKLIVPGILLMAAGLVVLTISRSHDAEYLNSIFEMKYAMPVSVSRTYIYIANNYDNFNCLIKSLPEHTWGLRMLFPLWAFTGLKFKVPALVNFPIYVTKAELTTVTLFYDAFYDFGVAGIVFLSAVVSVVCFCIEKVVRENNVQCGSVIYAQLAMYMILSFFTTWFSNPNTWFWLGVSVIVCIVAARRKEK